MIKLYGRLNSSNVQKVAWTLRELSLPFENEPLGGSFGGLDAPWYRALNPHCLVPTLVDGETVVWDSDAIVAYLGARYGDAAFWPRDPAVRAPIDAWIGWTKTVLDPAVMGLFWRTNRLPRAEQGRSDLGAEIARLGAAATALDGLLSERPWVSGSAFAFGDVAAGMLVYRYALLPVAKPETPHLDAWRRRLAARAAYREAVMMPFGTCYEDWIAFERSLGSG